MSGRDDPRPRPAPAVPLRAVVPERAAAASRHMLPPSRRRTLDYLNGDGSWFADCGIVDDYRASARAAIAVIREAGQ